MRRQVELAQRHWKQIAILVLALALAKRVSAETTNHFAQRHVVLSLVLREAMLSLGTESGVVLSQEIVKTKSLERRQPAPSSAPVREVRAGDRGQESRTLGQ